MIEGETNSTANGAPRFGWLAGAATFLAIAACYGTMLLVGALSLLGVTLALHEGAWPERSASWRSLRPLAYCWATRRHHALAPTILALAGAGLIASVMLGRYDRIVELVGFAALTAAAIWDWRLKRQLQKRKD